MASSCILLVYLISSEFQSHCFCIFTEIYHQNWGLFIYQSMFYADKYGFSFRHLFHTNSCHYCIYLILHLHYFLKTFSPSFDFFFLNILSLSSFVLISPRFEPVHQYSSVVFYYLYTSLNFENITLPHFLYFLQSLITPSF